VFLDQLAASAAADVVRIERKQIADHFTFFFFSHCFACPSFPVIVISASASPAACRSRIPVTGKTLPKSF
jgi:hypothetical protein